MNLNAEIIALTGLTILLFIVFGMQNIIWYESLALDISNGVTYILYPGLFSVYTFTDVALLGLMFILVKRLKLAILLISFTLYLWPMVFALSLLREGYVIGDQPRLEFATTFRMVEQGLSLEEAQKLSEYFYWPSFWILNGVYSGITRLSPLEAPPILMVSMYLVLGLYLHAFAKRVLDIVEGSNKKETKNLAIVLTPLILYTLNPYKILHPCPQIYALMLFLLLAILLVKPGTPALSDIILKIVLSLAIITSHPLTSIIVVGLSVIVVIYHLLLIFQQRKHELKQYNHDIVFSTLIITSFIAWNLNYEVLIKSVLDELLHPRIQELPPIIAGARLYFLNPFFTFMAIFRYVIMALLILTAFFTLIKLVINRKESRIIPILIGIIFGGLLLNFIPGSFLHRVLYFVSTVAVPFSATALYMMSRTSPVKINNKKIFGTAVLLLISPLIHLSLLEFLTNNNPVAIVTSPYEMHASLFIVERVHQTYVRSMTVPSVTMGFYAALFNSSTWNIVLMLNKAAYAPPPISWAFTEVFAKVVYSGDAFVVSPRELFVTYFRTGFHDFRLLDIYLNSCSNRIYDNGLYKFHYKSIC